jgi:hypothetical protein
MKKIILKITIAMSLLVIMCGIVMAAPLAQNISYQGILMDRAGIPYNGTAVMEFKLYNVPTGGSPLATSSHYIQVKNGQFTTNFTFNQNLYDGQALWLGVTIGKDSEMTPRQEILPVPYSLSLRPGAKITGSLPGFILDVINKGDAFSPALHAKTLNTNSSGIIAETTGAFSPALHANTTNTSSPGVYSITTGVFSPGLHAKTMNTNSPGLLAEATGINSTAVHAKTLNTNSAGIYTETTGAFSPGLIVNTTNTSSSGVYSETKGAFSPGLYAKTMNTNSPGLLAENTGDNSTGVVAFATGPFSHGVVGRAYGINSNGIVAYSEYSQAIWAQTNRSDHKYGVQTPDIIRALDYETASSDVAEFMPVSGDVSSGTVLIIGSDGKLQPSTISYDTRVAGIVSTSPGVSLGAKAEGNPGDALIAVAGRVPCKVDANYGAIHPGDILTTSDNPGFAMKAEPVNIGGIEIYKPGTVLGKAMNTLESGTGTIEVLVTLQ